MSPLWGLPCRAMHLRGSLVPHSHLPSLQKTVSLPIWGPFSRFFASPARKPSPFPSMLHPPPLLPREPLLASPLKTRVSTLANGIRVATEDTHGLVSAVGVFIGAGSRDETPENRGATFLLQRLGFKSTRNRSATQIAQDLDTSGGHVTNLTSREAMIYSGDILRGDLSRMVEILAECVQHPQFTDEEMNEQKQLLPHLLKELSDSPETFLPEVLHEVAYPSSALGFSAMGNDEVTSRLTRDHLLSFMSNHYVGSRMVIAGVGVDHDEFVSLTGIYFGTVPRGEPISRPPAVYEGGQLMLEGEPLQHATQEPSTYVVLAFEAPHYNDPDFYGVALWNSLLGGGSSFSSGGPGKGMYSRLYTNVLNRYDWAQSVNSFISCYTDTGLFGVIAASRPEDSDKMVDLLCTELYKSSENVEDVEYLRAKNQLKSSIFFNLESRAIQVDDIGRQILFQGAEEHCTVIDNYSKSDLYRVIRRVLRTPPTLVAYGPSESLKKIPSEALVQSFFAQSLAH